jgi:hypothetical protein
MYRLKFEHIKLNHVIFFISKPGKKKFLLFQFHVFRRANFSDSRNVKYEALYLHIQCTSYMQYKHSPIVCLFFFPIEISVCSTLVNNLIFYEHNVMQQVFMHYVSAPTSVYMYVHICACLFHITQFISQI